jgi:hypothetical protein
MIFMDHRMKTFQGASHHNCDDSMLYGYAKMKKDLAEFRETDREKRKSESGG